MASIRRSGTRSKRAKRQAPVVTVTHVAMGPALGDNVVSSTLEELEAALRNQPGELPRSWAAQHVIPVMPRVRPYPAGFPEPLRLYAPPGVMIGFAVDIGPAFLAVGADLIRSWNVSLAAVHARSLENLLVRAASIDRAAVVQGSLDGTPTKWLQTGLSIGAALPLAPDQVARIFGPGPQYFVTPMRDLIIGLPGDVDRELAAWLWAEVAAEDPNCVGPTGYRFDGTSVIPESLNAWIGLAPGGAPEVSTAFVS
jgi:hypothetical protein